MKAVDKIFYDVEQMLFAYAMLVYGFAQTFDFFKIVGQIGKYENFFVVLCYFQSVYRKVLSFIFETAVRYFGKANVAFASP